VRLRIRDDGVGFDAAGPSEIHSDDFGSGLSGIRDRVSLWGGEFSIESLRGQGTMLEVKLTGKNRENANG